MQEVFVTILFLLSVYFVGEKIYQEFTAKDGCAGGCAACSIPEKDISGKAIQS